MRVINGVFLLGGFKKNNKKSIIMAKSKGGHTGQFGRDITHCSYKGEKIVESTHRRFVTENGESHKREGQMLKIERYNEPAKSESFWESVGNPHTDDL